MGFQPLSGARQNTSLTSSDRVAADREPTVTAALSAQVGEPEKVERLRFTLPSGLTIAPGKATELNQPGFVRVQGKAKLGQSFLQGGMEGQTVTVILEAQHKVIGKADHVHLSTRMALPPLVDP
jgi:hypothetical protein